jgi:hypothetical protein
MKRLLLKAAFHAGKVPIHVTFRRRMRSMKVAEKIVLKIELSLILCTVSLILFLWPFLSTSILSSLKSLFFYLFIIWAITIGVLLIFSKRLDPADSTDPPDGKRNP